LEVPGRIWRLDSGVPGKLRKTQGGEGKREIKNVWSKTAHIKRPKVQLKQSYFSGKEKETKAEGATARREEEKPGTKKQN